MKALDRQRRQREVRGQVITGWRNSVKCSHGAAESPTHRNMKWWVCSWLYDWGVMFHTEASMRGGRCDVLVDDWAVVLEILQSESKVAFLKKEYPFVTIPIRAAEDSGEVLAMLTELRDTDGGAATFYRDLMMKRLWP